MPQTKRLQHFAIFVSMESKNEIAALLNLIEDPDKEVFEAVSNRIISYGHSIIANLEDLWEHSADIMVQQRIENLIQELRFNDLKYDFRQWTDAPHNELLPGSLLVAKLVYPELQSGKAIQDIERLRRNIWLELNNYLTPLEQINVFNSILFNYFGLKGTSEADLKTNDFLISKIIESKKGNQTGNGILYLILSELLDIPVKLIPIPGQFILAYFKSSIEREIDKLHLNIEFFIDPTLGQAFTHNDLYNYFSKVGITVKPEYFRPLKNKQVIEKYLTHFEACFVADNTTLMLQEIDELKRILNS